AAGSGTSAPRQPSPPVHPNPATRTRPATRIEEPPPRTPPRRGENDQKRTHAQGKTRTRRLNGKLRNRWRGQRSGPGAPAFAEPGLDGQLVQPEPGVDSSGSAAT